MKNGLSFPTSCQEISIEAIERISPFCLIIQSLFCVCLILLDIFRRTHVIRPVSFVMQNYVENVKKT